MARPKTGARLQTAYDLGKSQGYPPPENIANDPELLAAFDDGVTDAENGVDGGKPKAKEYRPPPAGEHRPKPRPAKRTKAPAKKAPAAKPATAKPSAAPSKARPTPPATSLPRPTLNPGRGDGSGFAFGLLLYVLGINFLRYGPRGVTGWFSAKFLNKPLTDLPARVGPSSAPASAPVYVLPATLVAPKPARSA